MSDEQDVSEDVSEEVKKETPKTVMYAVHNTVRSKANRAQRAASGRLRFVQRVGADQRRVLRSRPLHVSEAVLLAHLNEFKAKTASGAIEVRTLDGRKLDLSTMQAAALAATPPLPHPPLDSAANDLNGGQAIPQFPGGIPETQAFPMGEQPSAQVEEEEVELSELNEQEEVEATSAAGLPPELMPELPTPPSAESKEERRSKGRR